MDQPSSGCWLLDKIPEAGACIFAMASWFCGRRKFFLLSQHLCIICALDESTRPLVHGGEKKKMLGFMV